MLHFFVTSGEPKVKILEAEAATVVVVMVVVVIVIVVVVVAVVVSRTRLHSYGTAQGTTLSRCTLVSCAEGTTECGFILLQAAIEHRPFSVARY